MDNDTYEFPQIIKNAVKGLDNETRWKIVEYLMSKGNVSYSKLLKELNIPGKGSLTFHLDMLSKGAIIERRENFGEKTGDRIFYDISPIGKDIITGLLSAFTPTVRTVTAFQNTFEYFAATLEKAAKDKALFSNLAGTLENDKLVQPLIVAS